jgi:hypothetical protein
VVLRHLEALLGAPAPPPKRGSIQRGSIERGSIERGSIQRGSIQRGSIPPALLLPSERAALASSTLNPKPLASSTLNLGLNVASEAVVLVLVLEQIRSGLGQDICCICAEMVTSEEAASEAEALKSVVKVSAHESADPNPPPPPVYIIIIIIIVIIIIYAEGERCTLSLPICLFISLSLSLTHTHIGGG